MGSRFAADFAAVAVPQFLYHQGEAITINGAAATAVVDLFDQEQLVQDEGQNYQFTARIYSDAALAMGDVIVARTITMNVVRVVKHDGYQEAFCLGKQTRERSRETYRRSR
jgi:hypothetical protein